MGPLQASLAGFDVFGYILAESVEEISAVPLKGGSKLRERVVKELSARKGQSHGIEEP